MAIALVMSVAWSSFPLSGQQAAPPDYVVGPQDVLQVTVFNEPGMSGVLTVDNEGSINLPLIGRVSVDGLTLRETQDVVTQKLGDGYLVNPQVSVEIDEYRSQNVYVLGEVGRPGIYQLSGNLSLIAVLLEAGGVTAQAGNEVQINRSASGAVSTGPVLPEDGDSEVEVTLVSLEDIRTGRAGNVTLRDGDTVNVPKAATFFVMGQVGSSGSYVWTPGMTVQQAIALAGGYSSRGSDRGIRITRIIDGEPMDVGVNEDDAVLPGDIITIRPRRF
jgi:polysaccharide export outer membrane protein